MAQKVVKWDNLLSQQMHPHGCSKFPTSGSRDRYHFPTICNKTSDKVEDQEIGRAKSTHLRAIRTGHNNKESSHLESMQTNPTKSNWLTFVHNTVLVEQPAHQNTQVVPLESKYVEQAWGSSNFLHRSLLHSSMDHLDWKQRYSHFSANSLLSGLQDRNFRVCLVYDLAGSLPVRRPNPMAWDFFTGDGLGLLACCLAGKPVWAQKGL